MKHKLTLHIGKTCLFGNYSIFYAKYERKCAKMQFYSCDVMSLSIFLIRLEFVQELIRQTHLKLKGLVLTLLLSVFPSAIAPQDWTLKRFSSALLHPRIRYNTKAIPKLEMNAIYLFGFFLLSSSLVFIYNSNFLILSNDYSFINFLPQQSCIQKNIIKKKFVSITLRDFFRCNGLISKESESIS